MNKQIPDWLEQINWDNNGLIAAISQDHIDGEVLTIAWMNQEALSLTIEEQRAVYWSRSRNKIWRKGEESGHIQKLKEIYQGQLNRGEHSFTFAGENLIPEIYLGKIESSEARINATIKLIEN